VLCSTLGVLARVCERQDGEAKVFGELGGSRPPPGERGVRFIPASLSVDGGFSKVSEQVWLGVFELTGRQSLN
jgi:hypothetical protein